MPSWGAKETSGVNKEVQPTRQLERVVFFTSLLVEHVTNEEGVKKLSVQNAGNETGGTWKYTQEVNSTDTIC